MIPQITEVNFPSYATLHQASATLADMGDRTIYTQVKIDGDIVPDFEGWELVFKGERFVLPTREPQAVKDNTSRCSLVDLTFESWVINELKRYYFFSLASTAAGIAIPDKYKASVKLPLAQFVDMFNGVLQYYFGDTIRMDLNPSGSYSTDPVGVEISYTYMWEILTKFYDIFGVRWRLEYDSNDEAYVIKVGYPSVEIDDHEFEYGYKGGLLKFERQVQDESINNLLLGRGGEKNIPYRYFKRQDPQNPDWTPDPDALYELKDIYFDRLRDINFRWYVRGWMKNGNRDRTWENAGYVYPTYSDIPAAHQWAYELGRLASVFNPVEYVRDLDSIEKYGERWGALDDDDEIFPTIQGLERSGLGRIDEVVAVSEIVTDDIDKYAKNAATENDITGQWSMTANFSPHFTGTYVKRSNSFTVPSGKIGNVQWSVLEPMNMYGVKTAGVTVLSVNIVAVNSSGQEIPASGLGPGTYLIKASITVRNDLDNTASNVTFGLNYVKLVVSDQHEDAWKPTFDIWVKNIWNTTKNAGETDDHYAERVWRPILGDRLGSEAKIVFSDGFMAVSEDYEFTIVQYPVPDKTKTINGVPSEWKITLAKSDAEYDATGLFIPNAQTGGQPVAGNHFFFIGIDMPFMYVTTAEERLNDTKQNALNNLSGPNPQWVVTLDKIRAHTIEDEDYGVALADKLSAGALVYVKDRRFTNNALLPLYIGSITYSWTEDSRVPNIEVSLSDKVVAGEGVITSIQGQIDVIKSTYTRAADLEPVIRKVASPLFLKKNGESDTSSSPTTFASSVAGKSFRRGDFGGEGWGVYDDGEGSTTLELDKLIVRKEMHVNSLVVNQIAYVGGKQIISAAAIECTQVEDTDDGFVCYFDQKKGTVKNLFVVGDIALGQVFDPSNNEVKYYKAVVTAIGDDFITLSKTNKAGGGIPAVGDVIVQYGNINTTSRQYVIVRDVIGGGYERMLSGLGSVSSNGDEYYFAGRQSGDTPKWFVGDANGENAMYKDGVFTVTGKIVIRGGSSGLTNMEEWPGIQEELDATSESAQRALDTLALINNDTVLDPAEKGIIRTEWITINGIEDTDKGSTKGSYYKTRQEALKYSALGGQQIFTFNGQIFTYNNTIFTYANLGPTALDAAYLALRTYLNSVELNNKTAYFEGFDRATFSELLRKYYDEELSVVERIDDALNAQTNEVRQSLLRDLQDYETAINASIQEMQDVIDNTIETFFYTGVPTLANLPASGWTEDEYYRHIGDLYYDNATGLAYRFQRTGTEGNYTYYWNQLSDSAIAEALAAAARAQDTADHKRRVFRSQPTTEDAYDVGDLWLDATIGTYQNEMLVCQHAKAAGVQFSASDWTLATKYTDDTVANSVQTQLDTFLGNYQGTLQTIIDQVDGKAETWYQATDPADDWTAAEKPSHEGDIWHNTSNTTVSGVPGGQDAIYSGSAWVVSATIIPQEVYDRIDGKAAVYVTLPIPAGDTLNIGDILIPASNFTYQSVDYKINKLYKYNGTSWVELNYTDDTLASALQAQLNTFLGSYQGTLQTIIDQVDEKAQTWYQGTDPASDWSDAEKPDHEGDIWHNTSNSTVSGVPGGQDAIYSGSAWVVSETIIPQAVYDKIDGKAAVYVSLPIPQGETLHEGDILIPVSTFTYLNVEYVANKLYKYNGTTWVQLDYTNDARLDTFLTNTYAPFVRDITDQVDHKAQTWYMEDDPSVFYSWSAEEKPKHKGDIWHNTSQTTKSGVKSGQDAIYSGSAWVVDETVPQEVYDKIDGKAAIYTTWNAWIVNNISVLHVNDVFIPTSNTTPSGSQTTYYANRFYRCTAITPSIVFEEIDYTNESEFQQFLSGYQTAISSINTQLDKKAETWVSPTDPSTQSGWVDSEHEGDIWWNTDSSTQGGVSAGGTAVYTLSGSTYSWVEMPVPKSVFDQIDGKADIFVTKPTAYNKFDLWIIESGLSVSDMPSGCQAGDIVIADNMPSGTTKRTSYVASDWRKKDRYTDDSGLRTFINGTYATDLRNVKDSVDEKAETWVADVYHNPAANWDDETLMEEHLGDIWMNITPDTNGNTHTYIYRKTGAGTEQDPYVYSWEEVNGVPTSVFDMADGKASIYVARPSSYNKNDLWIIETGLAAGYMPSGCKAGDIVIADNMPSGTTKRTSYVANDWRKKDRYTDDSAVETLRDDLEYLEGAFANYDTHITGGVVLSHFIGVKNASGSVVAAMNGESDPTILPGFQNTTHGILMIAAGLSSLGDTTHEATAATKIYSDGTIITNRLIANEGKISFLDITSNSLEINKTPQLEQTGTIRGFNVIKEGYLSLGGRYYYDSYYSGHYYPVSSFEVGISDQNAYIAGDPLYAASLSIERHKDDTTASGSCYNCGFSLSVAGDKSVNTGIDITSYLGATARGIRVSAAYATTNYGIEVSASGGTTNYAIYCKDGTFAGLRPKVRYVQNSGVPPAGPVQLDEFDFYVIVDNTTVGVTLALPATPKEGQTYVIVHIRTPKVYVSGNGHKIRANAGPGDTYKEDTASYSARGTMLVVWSATYNCWVLDGLAVDTAQ